MSLERFFTAKLAPAAPGGFKIPVAPRNLARPARWVPAGETVEVSDYILRGGLLYVGTGMKDPQGTPEPSLINPLCPIQATYGDYSTKTLDYWPNYAAITPEARGAYLGWLASGRDNVDINIGFVFLYFYGLERRALIDSFGNSAAQDEWPVIIAEVTRLNRIFGPANRAFSEKMTRFLELLAAAKHAKNLIIRHGKYSSSVTAMSLELKKNLGLLSLNGVPLPVETAFLWVKEDPAINRGTALNRCALWFEKLFAHHYSQVHGEGLVIPVGRTKLMMQYEPASQAVAGYGEIGVYFDNLPDVTVDGGVTSKLQLLVSKCDEQLSAYSRFVGRNPDLRMSIEALVLLPDVLWPESLRASLNAWSQKVGAGPVLATPRELITTFGAQATASKDVLPVLNALSTLGIRIEPELTGRVPGLDDPLALFQDELTGEADFSRALPAYTSARATLQLAHCVAQAEPDNASDAQDYIQAQVAGWVHLSLAQRRRLSAYAKHLSAAPPALATLKKNIAGLDPLSRSAVGSFLCRVAQLGRDASPATVKLLGKFYKLLELDAERLHAHLHAAAAGSAARPHAESARELNVTKIASLQKDSAAVSAMLADIFVDESAPVEDAGSPPAPSALASAPADASRLWGLSEPLSALVTAMQAQTHWERSALLPLAAGLGLMLDGALEQINEAAFDAFDMAFVEGESPYEINQDLMQEQPQ